MAQWAQTIIAAIVALAGGFGGVAWIGARVGAVDSRLVVVERFANGHDDKWTREIHGVESRVAGLERECSRVQFEYPVQLQNIDRRVGILEGLIQRFAELAPLTDRQKRVLEQRYAEYSRQQSEQTDGQP